MTIELFGANVSPFYERVVVFLEMKGATENVVFSAVPGGPKSAEHMGHHPMGMIPFLLKEDGSSLTEGQLIIDYLDTVLDGPKMIPADIDAAVQAQAVARIFDLYFGVALRPFGAAFFGGTPDEAAVKAAREVEIPKVLGYLEKYISGGSYAVGEGWTIADAVLISQFYWYDLISERFDLPSFEPYPKLAASWAAIRESDYAKNSFVRVEESFKQFFGGDKA